MCTRDARRAYKRVMTRNNRAANYVLKVLCRKPCLMLISPDWSSLRDILHDISIFVCTLISLRQFYCYDYGRNPLLFTVASLDNSVRDLQH